MFKQGDKVKYDGNVYYVLWQYEDRSAFLVPELPESWSPGSYLPHDALALSGIAMERHVKPLERELKGFAAFIRKVA